MPITILDYKGRPITCEQDLDEMVFCPDDDENDFLELVQDEFEEQDFEFSQIKEFSLDWEGYSEDQQDRWKEFLFKRLSQIFNIELS